MTNQSSEEANIQAYGASDRLGLTTILGGGLTPSKRAWQSQATSIFIHALVVIVLLAITVPVIQVVHQQARMFLIAPQLSRFRPKINRSHIQPARPLITAVSIPPPVIKVPEVKSQPIAPRVIAPTPTVTPAEPTPKIEAFEPSPAPRPQVRTGVFEAADLAAKGAKQMKTGGFGDPQGVRPNTPESSSITMAKLGSFDLTNGDGKGGAAGRGVVQGAFAGTLGPAASSGSRHGVRAGGFGDGSGTGTSAVNGNGHGGEVHTAGFGDAAAQAPSVQHPIAAAPATTPTEIVFKPKPVYSEEARHLKIEGQVAIEVVFQASGTIRVMRMIHGLGHGLDEAAQQAAQQVRFRPATRGGIAVDTTATIYITFELT